MSFENNFQHEIQESSCLFQGYKGNFFTKNGISFKITQNEDDTNELGNINIRRYERTLKRNVHNRIDLRNEDKGSIPHPHNEDIIIKYIKLLNESSDNERSNDNNGRSGYYAIYPTIAICTESHCNKYFDLNYGKNCKHAIDKWEQINFVAFCDTCGIIKPLHKASNLGYNCIKCNSKNTLTILHWGRKDQLGTYKIECEQCNYKPKLIFYKCNHIDTNNIELSSEAPTHFTPTTVRMGTIIHPVVITIPDILDDHNESSTDKRRARSENFSFYFPNVDESILNVSRLKELIIKDDSFWKQKGVSYLADEMFLDPDSLKEPDGQLKFKRLIMGLLEFATTTGFDNAGAQNIKDKYGISNLEQAINQIPQKVSLDEDWEGIFLLNQKETNPDDSINNSEEHMKKYGKTQLYTVRSIPNSIPEKAYTKWLKNNHIRRIRHVAGLNMIQALIGVIEGSTRRNPPLFNVISTGKKKNPTIFIRTFVTEGIIFQLDYEAILKWFQANQNIISSEPIELEQDKDFESLYQKIILENPSYRDAAYKLLHTLSHMLIQQSTVHTGLDSQSLSEKIYPMVASIFIYSTNNINIGGLEYTFDTDITNWFARVRNLASDCPQDPSCMIDEEGACNACSYLPEFVCENFNQSLDRSALIGFNQSLDRSALLTLTRFIIGFFDNDKSSS